MFELESSSPPTIGPNIHTARTWLDELALNQPLRDVAVQSAPSRAKLVETGGIRAEPVMPGFHMVLNMNPRSQSLAGGGRLKCDNMYCYEQTDFYRLLGLHDRPLRI